jgi:predicted porin
MKKSLLALAVLGVFAGGALAQSSSVTLGGIVDLNGRSVKNGSNDALRTMNSDGINSSRLYFRGTEDLGGGMSAGFWLEAGMANDSGNVGGSIGTAAPTNGSSNFFNRRSTVSLLGGWGEIRLGRDYTSGFWNTTVFDPFGTNGVGAFTNLSINALGTTGSGGNTSYVRSNNTIGYFLPGNLGGLYGQAQVSANEAAVLNGNKQQSARLGYAAGPINVAVSHQTTKTTPQDWKHTNLAASYNFGFASLMGQYDLQKSGARKQKTFLIGAVVPMGQGEFHIAYDKADQSGGGFDNADANQIGIGYVYNLSKRTALYGTYARISNDNAQAAFAIGGGSGSAANAKSTGYEVGLRHAF